MRTQDSLQRKVDDQHQIVEFGEDVRVLKKAIASFTKLQHVRLLRVADWDQRNLLMRRPEGSEQFLRLNWTDACSHASRTIGEALLSANVPWCRFSSPQISPQSAERLTSLQIKSLYTLAARLTCLTMVFVDASDDQVRHLSGLFRSVFKTAVNMQAVHVGFASRTPLSLPLEEVFNHVTWSKVCPM